jgi:23S rRNA pseudouridine1911/1915/1917 synthase
MLPNVEILYEDNHIIAIDKPPGMLSQGDSTGDLDVLTLIKEVIRQRDKKPGNVYLGLVHRLDRPVGGVMVLAKTSKAAGRLSRQIRERETRKIYRAVVQGALTPKEAALEHFLFKDKKSRVTTLVDSNAPQGKRAKLSYRVLAIEDERSLVEIDLETGYSHQIRAQLSAVGHPVIGDRKYGSTIAFAKGRIALYSKSITFMHPTRKSPLTITAEPPPNWPFN